MPDIFPSIFSTTVRGSGAVRVERLSPIELAGIGSGQKNTCEHDS